MFGFKSKAQKDRELDERVAALVEKRESERIEKEVIAKKVAQAEAEAEEKRKAELIEAAKFLELQNEENKKNSDEPWIKVESSQVDTDGNIRMKLDWNPAFVRYLKNECGFSGDEDNIVQKWIGALYREIHVDSKNDALNILTSPGHTNPNDKD